MSSLEKQHDGDLVLLLLLLLLKISKVSKAVVLIGRGFCGTLVAVSSFGNLGKQLRVCDDNVETSSHVSHPRPSSVRSAFVTSKK
jgi:hypothetical protein